MKRVILLKSTDQYPFEHSLLLEMFSRCLPNEGYVTTFLQLQDRPEKRPAVDRLGEVKVINAGAMVKRGRWSKLLPALINPFIYGWHFVAQVRLEKPAVIQVRDYTVGLVLALLARMIWRLPVCYHQAFPFQEAILSFYDGQQGPYAWLRRSLARMELWLKKKLIRRADHIQVMSETMFSQFAEQGFSTTKMSVLSMGVDPQSVPFSLPLVDVTDLAAPIKVAYLGTLSQLRKPEKMLEVAHWMTHRLPHIKFMFIGGLAAEIAAMIQAATELGVQGYCEFTGHLPRQEALELVRHAQIGLSLIPPIDIFEVSSPTKLIEMMALGLPVVASHGIPEQEWLIEQSGGGILVDMVNTDEIGAAILHLAYDGTLRRQMGEQGRRFVAEHKNYRKMAHEVATWYDQVSRQRS